MTINEKLDRIFTEEDQIDLGGILPGMKKKGPPPVEEEEPLDPNLPSKNQASGDISTSTAPEPEAFPELGDSTLDKPEQVPPLAADEPEADVAAQTPEKLEYSKVAEALTTVNSQLKSMFGEVKENDVVDDNTVIPEWTQLGSKLGIDDERVTQAYPTIGEQWNALGAFGKQFLISLNVLASNAGKIISGGIKGPPEPESTPEAVPGAEEEITPEDLPKPKGLQLPQLPPLTLK